MCGESLTRTLVQVYARNGTSVDQKARPGQEFMGQKSNSRKLMFSQLESMNCPSENHEPIDEVTKYLYMDFQNLE